MSFVFRKDHVHLNRYDISTNFSSTIKRYIIFILGVSKDSIIKIILLINCRKNFVSTEIYFIFLNMFLCVRTVVVKIEQFL